MANTPLTQTTGRRKEAVARAVVRAGSGKLTVNGRPIEAYFTTATQRMVVTEALRVVDREQSFDIDANIFGGGVNGQAGALRMAIARSLIEMDPETRPALKKAVFLLATHVVRKARSTVSRRRVRRLSSPSVDFVTRALRALLKRPLHVALRNRWCPWRCHR